MGRADFKFCARRTRQERVRDRKHIILWDAAITKRTQERYHQGLQKLLPHLDGIKATRHLDDVVTDWIQHVWETGESIHTVSDALCGLQHYQPWTKYKIPQAWRLFRVWRKVESPNRAPPLTAMIVESMVLYAIDHNDLQFACMLVLGFWGLLRTGEFLQVTARDIMVGSTAAVVSLKNTKTGLRNAGQETVSITEDLALEVLLAATQDAKDRHMSRVPLWTRSAQCFRNAFRHHCKVFHILDQQFRPYSLRRGGATALFQATGSMEQALLKGRWGSSKVAKIYLADGLSYLPGLTFKPEAKAMLQKWSVRTQLSFSKS